MHRLVGAPVAMAAARGGGVVPRHRLAAVDRLVSQVTASLADRTVTLSWIHGDFWLGNVIVGESGEIAGIIDWGGMDRAGLPGIDIVHLILTTRTLRSGRELGPVVLEALDDPDCSESESALLDMIEVQPGSSWWRTLVLLAWVNHLASNVRKSDRYRSNWLWAARNVDHVLSTL